MADFRWLKVEPCSSKTGSHEPLYIDLRVHSVRHLTSDLVTGEPVTGETLMNSRITEMDLDDYEGNEERGTQACCEEAARDLVAILNFVLEATGEEVDTDSVFILIERKEELTCPDVGKVAKLLEGKKSWIETHKEENGWMEIRLQVREDGGWRLWSGDPQYDTDHRGFWGNGLLHEDTDVKELATELIADVQSHFVMSQ